MSEHHEQLTDKAEHAEHLHAEAEIKKNLERIHEKAAAHEHDHNIDKLQKSIHEQALSSKETPIGEQHHDSQPVHKDMRELKSEAYKRTLQRTRAHLSPTERTFSKFVHRPAVETATDIAGRSLARPSGMLGGGLAALLGSGLVLYMGKYYGFRYNFFIFIPLFAGGFVLGLVAELLVRTLARRRA